MAEATQSLATPTPQTNIYEFGHNAIPQGTIPIIQNALVSGALKGLNVNVPNIQTLVDSMVQWKSENISSTGKFTVVSFIPPPTPEVERDSSIAFLAFSSESLTIGDCLGSQTFNDISNSKLATSTYGQGATLAFHVPSNVQNVNYVVDLSPSNINSKRKRRSPNNLNKVMALRLYSGSTYLGIANFPYILHDSTQTSIQFSMIQGYFHGIKKKQVVHMNCKDIGPNDVQDNGKYQELWSIYKASLSSDGSDGGENNEFEGAVDALAEEYLFQAFQRYLKRMKYCRDTHPGSLGNDERVKKRHVR
ncbi:UNVERIFIED_CONTAM: hypothetical protein HDU68_010273 [Siphonaria sp. JEL0065]|nr:hypothetical protein HDU68_010273 [Siphonaria sp. JEL0065]